VLDTCNYSETKNQSIGILKPGTRYIHYYLASHHECRI